MSNYTPIVRDSIGAFQGTALVGTYSIIIGWNLTDPSLRLGLHGFAIKKTTLDPETNEILELAWLRGHKRFEETDNGKAEDISSLEAPFQRFRWNEYTLKPNRKYIYEVFQIRGTVTDLKRDGQPLKFEVVPSQEDQNDLGIFVNRGVTASMAYLARFKNKSPKEIGKKAYYWLSRGLKESLLDFISSTQKGDELHIAIYEFHDHEIAKSIQAAIQKGVIISIVIDDREGKNSTKKSRALIKEFGFENIIIKRTKVKISHNKVVIKVVNNKPTEVWTGSANFSENAFYLQTNAALIIRDTKMVEYYEAYFQYLSENPSKAQSKVYNLEIMKTANALENRFAEKIFFSPIKNIDILETAKTLITNARSIVMVSAPFGLEPFLIDALNSNSEDIMEYGLVNAVAKRKIDSLQRKNTRFFTPNKLKSYMGRTWDARSFGHHKIHTKTIIVDPWSDQPKVLFGSANFSDESCIHNDENAFLITGNKRLAAIMATEFIRMYDHYKSRFYIDKFNDSNKLIKKENKQRILEGLEPLPLNEMNIHLEPDEEWSRTSYNEHSRSHKYRDREVFSGNI